MSLIIVSGLSGSGKTIALQTLEDQGIYCVDNLPVSMIPQFMSHVKNNTNYTDVAIGLAARAQTSDITLLETLLDEGHLSGLGKIHCVYIEAAPEIILKRYNETRRKHPLTSTEFSLEEAINKEIDLLAPIAKRANWVLDTTYTAVQDFRDLLREQINGDKPALKSILIQSFGYKHGQPTTADFMFDVRCLPNPYWDLSLRDLTGLDDDIQTFFESKPIAQKMIDDLRNFLLGWLPEFHAGDRQYITIAMGCTGGRHRSVYVTEALAESLRQENYHVLARHSQLDKK